MAIKLADVIENINSDYAVVDTQKQNILGIYNGSIGSVPPIELYYSSSEKIALTSDGDNLNRIQVYRDPLSLQAADDLVDVSMDLKFHTRQGAIFSVHDEKLNDGSGGPALYLTKQDPSPGTSVDAGRSAIGRFREVVQQFNSYQTISAASAQELTDTAGENFWLAGYHTQHESMKKMALDSLLGYITSELMGNAVEAGLVTSSNAGETSQGSGVFGDLNGDGSVSTADYLLFLAEYGQGPQPSAFDSISKAMTGASEETALIGVSIASPTGNSNTEFVAGDFDNVVTPSSLTVDVANLGNNQSLTVPTSAAAYVEIDDITITANNSNFYANKAFHFFMDVEFTFSAIDLFYALVLVDYTTANDTTYTELYHMNLEGNGLGGTGTLSAPGGPFDVGTTYTETFEFRTLNAAGANPTFNPNIGTFNPGSNSSLPISPITVSLASSPGGQNITKVRFTPLFTSYTGSVSLKVTEMRTHFKVPD